MTRNRRTVFRRPVTIAWLMLVLLLVFANPVLAEEPVLAVEDTVLMQAPASDAAIVTGMPGFPVINAESLLQSIRISPEGIVVRQSRIENGQVVIPPGGLYYDLRQGGLRFPLVNYPISILGDMYYLVDWDVLPGVMRDFTIKNGEAVPFGSTGDHALEASISSSWSSTSPHQGVTFKILKPSGNYYGTEFGPLYTGDEFVRPAEEALAGPTGEPEHTVLQADRLATSGVSYVVVSKVTAEEAVVAEWGYYEMPAIYLATGASDAVLGVDETMPLGEYQARVVAIDAENMTVDVAIETAAGEVVAEKTLGPLSAELLSLLPSDHDGLKSLLLKHEDVQVSLDAFREPFPEEGKVSLVGNTGVFKFAHGGLWEPDPRFVTYVDT